MLGVTLYYTYLSTGKGHYSDSPERLLKELSEKGVESVEISMLHRDTNPKEVLRICNMIREAGLRFTVHSCVDTADGAVEEVFCPLSLVLNEESDFVSVIHPIASGNDIVLSSLSREAEKYPKLKIAMENNRHMPTGTEGDCAVFVENEVKNADLGNVGICFDMGHYYYYSTKFGAPELPGEEFRRRVIHTHVHATTKELRTHFPLDEYTLPLKKYMASLGDYNGIWNLEIDPGRFEGVRDAKDALFASIDVLKKQL